MDLPTENDHREEEKSELVNELMEDFADFSLEPIYETRESCSSCW